MTGKNPKMSDNSGTRAESGARGEAVAAGYLEGLGMRLAAKNFRTRHGEIDIVALDGDTLVFVEVKYRSSRGHGAPHEFVTRSKIERIKKAAWYFVERNKLFDAYMRFDVIGVSPEGIEHFKNAF